MKQCHTHTTTMGEEDNTEAVTVLISKMAAKHLTRVLFLSALSSAISSSLSRSCSRQTFSSLVNTANSCGTHKLRSGANQTNYLNVWYRQFKWCLHSFIGKNKELQPDIVKCDENEIELAVAFSIHAQLVLVLCVCIYTHTYMHT